MRISKPRHEGAVVIDLKHLIPRDGPAWPLFVIIDGKAEVRWGPMCVARAMFYGRPERLGWEILGPYEARDLAEIFKRVAEVESSILARVHRVSAARAVRTP